MQDFARNQVGAQLNTLASSVLTLDPDSDDHAGHHRLHNNHHQAAGGHGAARWASPDNGNTAGFEGFDDSEDSPAGGREGGAQPSDGHRGPHVANGNASGAGDFQDVPLDDTPPKTGAAATARPRKGGAAALAAMREENAGLKQRLAAIEAVSTSAPPESSAFKSGPQSAWTTDGMMLCTRVDPGLHDLHCLWMLSRDAFIPCRVIPSSTDHMNSRAVADT